jgi:hypothetical protein
MRQQAMKTQFCWFDAAKKYEAVYDRALARRAAWK